MGRITPDTRSKGGPREVPAPDGHLAFILKQYNITPCDVLNIGCGRAESLLWLAGRQFACLGVDVASTTLRLAREAAAASEVQCRFAKGTFPEDFGPGIIADESFDFVFDYGVLNLVTQRPQQRKFLKAVARILRPGGIYYSLLCRREGSTQRSGPPRWTFNEVRTMVTMVFRLALLRPVPAVMNDDSTTPSWLCVVKKTRSDRPLARLTASVGSAFAALRSRMHSG